MRYPLLTNVKSHFFCADSKSFFLNENIFFKSIFLQLKTTFYSLYNYSIWFWACSNSVVFCCHFFLMLFFLLFSRCHGHKNELIWRYQFLFIRQSCIAKFPFLNNNKTPFLVYLKNNIEWNDKIEIWKWKPFPKTFQCFFSIPIFWLWVSLMKVIPETRGND